MSDIIENEELTEVVDVPKEELSEIIGVTRAMSEGDFYKEMSSKLQGELGDLARYIDRTRKNLQKLHPAVTETSERIPDASSQLSAITRATEEATHKVISITERVMDTQEMLSYKVKELKDIAALQVIEGSAILKITKDIEAIIGQNNTDLVETLTALSFQDITGQQIKKIISLVQDVEGRILDLLMSFKLKNGEEQKKEKIIEQLKDPAKGLGINQGLVDDLLRELGL